MKIFEFKKQSNSQGKRELHVSEDASIITLEELIEVINTVIQPDNVDKTQITSWTESFTFQKNGISVYVEYFYDSDPYYSFELHPLRANHNEEDKQKLLQIINQLDEFLDKK